MAFVSALCLRCCMKKTNICLGVVNLIHFTDFLRMYLAISSKITKKHHM